MHPVRNPYHNPFAKTQAHFSYSKEEEFVNQALASAMYGVPPQPDRDPFPPRHGYERGELTIHEVLNTDRFTGKDRRMDYSGTYGHFSGTARPAIGSV